MTHLIRAELLKLRTTRTFWAYVGAAVAFVPLSVALAMTSGSEPLDSPDGVRNVVAAASSGGLVLLVLGILMMAGEFRHGTATSTFLITPDRRRVVAAKVVAASLVGLVVAIVDVAGHARRSRCHGCEADGVDVASYGSDVALGLLGAIAATALAPRRGRRLRRRRHESDGRHHDRPDLEPGRSRACWSASCRRSVAGCPAGPRARSPGIDTPNGGLLPMWAAAIVLAAYGLAFAAAGVGRSVATRSPLSRRRATQERPTRLSAADSNSPNSRFRDSQPSEHRE